MRVLPKKQPFTNIFRIKAQALTDAFKGKKPIVVLFCDPLFGLIEYGPSPAIWGEDMLLEAIGGILQNRQHQPFLWLQLRLPAKGLKILSRKNGVWLEKEGYFFSLPRTCVFSRFHNPSLLKDRPIRSIMSRRDKNFTRASLVQTPSPPSPAMLNKTHVHT